MEEVDNLFKNVDIALKAAGISQGWGAVYQVTAYRNRRYPSNLLAICGKALDKYVAGKPAWTGVPVYELWKGAWKSPFKLSFPSRQTDHLKSEKTEIEVRALWKGWSEFKR